MTAAELEEVQVRLCITCSSRSSSRDKEPCRSCLEAFDDADPDSWDRPEWTSQEES